MRTAVVAIVVLYSLLAFADPSAKERRYPRTNGWNWEADTTNKGTPSCMDKYGHEAGRIFVSYLGSVTEFLIADRTIKISAGPNVPAVTGKKDQYNGDRYFVLPQPLFFGKEKPTFGGAPVAQIVSYTVDSHLTTLNITFLAMDGNTVTCDEIFWTILEVK
jgi:hypothetical protein